MNPFFWVAAALVAFVCWRAVNRRGGRSRTGARRRRGTASNFGPFGVTILQFYNPGAKHVLEQQLEAESQRDDEDAGDPPGAAPAPRPGCG